jgi:hypothetical protein
MVRHPLQEHYSCKDKADPPFGFAQGRLFGDNKKSNCNRNNKEPVATATATAREAFEPQQQPERESERAHPSSFGMT